MSPNLKLKVQTFNRKVLSTNSWKLYLKLLRVLESSTVPSELTTIIQFLEDGRVKEAYELADSLGRQTYSTPREHFRANQIVALIKKYPFPNGINPFNPESMAREKFSKAELKCAEFNALFKKGLHGEKEYFLARARAFIRYVLGESPNLAAIYGMCDFGPGASIGVHGNATNLARKLSCEKWSVSPGAYHFVKASMNGEPLIHELLARDRREPFYDASLAHFAMCFDDKITIVDYNKIAFVPKTAATHRSIAVEPLLNTYIQKGVDSYMRILLKRIGIDLSDQGINSEYARLGSITGAENPFCTIDLSSASDSISIELVRDLLPPDWFIFLNSIRSENYQIDGVKHRYEKFCSMGNGFCFPLETLIFAAACHAVDPKSRPGTDFLVYGDDIVIRQSSTGPLILLLEYMGFDVNSDKTFVEGPFRESCGRDWFAGEDVRPFILDFALDSIQSINKFCNLTLRNSKTSLFFAEVREFLMSLLPHELLFLRPEIGGAEGAITVDLDLFMSSKYAKFSRSLQTWTWREIASTPVPDRIRCSRYDTVIMIAALRGVDSRVPFTMRRMTRTRVATNVAHS